VLDSCTVRAPRTSPLPLRTLTRHLTLLGTVPAHSEDGATDVVLGHPFGSEQAEVRCSIPWGLPNEPCDELHGELLVQATSGLAAVHGRERGRPDVLCLEIASFAAGVVATTGVLAALIAARRGQAVRSVETSVLEAALFYLRHHLAVATCTDRSMLPERAEGSGSPFPTADGICVEIDFANRYAWDAFWARLGAAPADVARGWVPFAFHYVLARCPLPPGLHEVLRRHRLQELVGAADVPGAGVRPLRTYDELRARPRQDAPWTIGDGAPAAAASQLDAGDPPLSGMRVVEVTTRVQGPLAGAVLRMLGADVLRVEPPGGDPARLAPPFTGSESATFAAYNHGKESLELDYKTPSGLKALRDLAGQADIFLHNWPAGRARDLGLDPAGLASRGSGAVSCHAGGWGAGSRELATDSLVQAELAFAEGCTPAGEPPVPSRLTIVDVLGGLIAAEAALAAVLSGRGASASTSLLSAGLDCQSHVLGRRCLEPLDRPRPTAAGFSLRATMVPTDLAALPTDPVVGPLLQQTPAGCWLPAAPWRFAR
jgi:CoA:oxalate CoA-transferase